MVRLRLTRIGRKNAPAFRILAIHKDTKRDGKALEILGHYNPSENPVKFEINKERYDYWISTGAQPSFAVSKLVDGKYKFKPYKKGKSAEDTPAAELPKETEAVAEQASAE